MRASFQETLRKNRIHISRSSQEILQINVGKRCNQACHHCHVEAGPKRTERMELNTVHRILELMDQTPSIHTVDITGGAPELNPYFRFLVEQCRKREKTIIDRCNLTVLLEKGQETTAKFLSQMKVQIIASLPCYTKENVDHQRGSGVFEKSIQVLRLLNQLGYGLPGSGLELHLIYNPGGPFLPAPQEELEGDYKTELKSHFGIEFNRLLTLTNMPIRRFLWDLEKSGELEEYMNLLVSSFNPSATSGLMCRNLISVSWDGQIYDCDFNQMLELTISYDKKSVWEIQSFDDLSSSEIRFENHCYGCTAGAGSSCRGALVG